MWGCSGGDSAQSTDDLVKTVNVETRQLSPETFNSHLKLIGTVDAANDVRISAEESGNIVKYYVDEGSQVKKGQLIAKIDDSQLQQEKARLQAITSQAQDTYERQKRLWEQDSVGSEIDYLNAKYNYEQNKANLEAVKVRINKTKVRSPIDAVLETKLVEQGEMVTPGMPMLRLIGNNQIKVVAGVPARYSDVIQVGDTASVWFDTVNSDTLKGKITYVASSIDPQARTFRIETVLPNNNNRYKVDMVANINLRTMHRPNVIIVGEEYVYQKNGGYIMYTVGKNEEGHLVAKEQRVTLGPSYENRTVIEKGLKPGDDLITVGSSYLKDNMRIKIVNNPDNSFTDGKGVQ